MMASEMSNGVCKLMCHILNINPQKLAIMQGKDCDNDKQRINAMMVKVQGPPQRENAEDRPKRVWFL